MQPHPNDSESMVTVWPVGSLCLPGSSSWMTAHSRSCSSPFLGVHWPISLVSSVFGAQQLLASQGPAQNIVLFLAGSLPCCLQRPLLLYPRPYTIDYNLPRYRLARVTVSAALPRVHWDGEGSLGPHRACVGWARRGERLKDCCC